MKPRTKLQHLASKERVAEAIVRKHVLSRPNVDRLAHCNEMWWKPVPDCSCTACVQYRRALRTLRTGR